MTDLTDRGLAAIVKIIHERIDELEKAFATHQMAVYKRIEKLEEMVDKHEINDVHGDNGLSARIGKLEERSNADWNFMDQLRIRIGRGEDRIDKLEESLKPTGFKEYKASGWEGVKRESKGVEDKRGYTGW